MFKVEITLVLIVALVITGGEGKIGKPGNKPPGRQVDCNSDNLPDIAENADKCALEAKVEVVINKFSAKNQVLVRQLIAEMKSLRENEFKTATSSVISSQASLISQFQTVDPNGYNAFNALVASSNAAQTCTEKAASMTAFVNSLNDQGKVVSKKIGCFVKQNVQQTSKSTMGQFFLTNMDTFATLKREEAANVNELMDLFKNQMNN